MFCPILIHFSIISGTLSQQQRTSSLSGVSISEDVVAAVVSAHQQMQQQQQQQQQDYSNAYGSLVNDSVAGDDVNMVMTSADMHCRTQTEQDCIDEIVASSSTGMVSLQVMGSQPPTSLIYVHQDGTYSSSKDGARNLLNEQPNVCKVSLKYH